MAWSAGRSSASTAALAIFGDAVALAGTQVLIGAQGDGEIDINAGATYAFELECLVSCPADLDGTGAFGLSDLLIVLSSWGPCLGCPADFNGDGTVGLSDLLALLSTWGPCA